MHALLIRSSLVAVLTVAVAGMGIAHADDENNSGVGPFSKANYPSDVIDRPLTLPGGMLEVGLGLAYASLSVAGVSADATSAGVSARYGVGNKIMVGVDTSLGIDPDFEWGESLGLGVSYLAVDQKKLDVRAGVSTDLNFADGADVFSGVNIDAATRFKVNNAIALTGGSGLLSIRTSDPSQVDADINVGVLLQAIPKLAISVETQLVSLGITGDGNETTHLGDAIPVTIQVGYTPQPKLDVILTAAFPSVEDAGDFYIIGLGALYRL